MSHFLPGIPAISLMQAERALPDHPEAEKWRDAVRLYLDEYVLPMTSRNVFRIMPLGLFNGSPSEEVYRPLGGDSPIATSCPPRGARTASRRISRVTPRCLPWQGTHFRTKSTPTSPTGNSSG